jgi:hypothetical protein
MQNFFGRLFRQKIGIRRISLELLCRVLYYVDGPLNYLAKQNSKNTTEQFHAEFCARCSLTDRFILGKIISAKNNFAEPNIRKSLLILRL